MQTNNIQQKPGSIQQNLMKYFYSGVGLAANTADIMQKSVEEIKGHSKANTSEGKRIINNALKRVDASYRNALHKFVEFTSSEVSKLKDRVEMLEKRKPAGKGAMAMSATQRTTVRKAGKPTSKARKATH